MTSRGTLGHTYYPWTFTFPSFWRMRFLKEPVDRKRMPPKFPILLVSCTRWGCSAKINTSQLTSPVRETNPALHHLREASFLHQQFQCFMGHAERRGLNMIIARLTSLNLYFGADHDASLTSPNMKSWTINLLSPHVWFQGQAKPGQRP
jgi:hypothetical protein